MSDNIVSNGYTIRTLDNGSTIQKQVVVLDYASSGAEALASTGINRYPVSSYPNAVKGTNTLHRNAITAIDKLLSPSTMTSVTDVTSGGSLAQGTQYFITAAAANKYGVTTPGTTGNVTTAASGGSVHCIKGTLAQVTGAEYYDIFMSTSSTATLWVGRLTESQRANANGFIFTAVGTGSAGSSLGAGVIQVNVVGTGLAINAIPFVANTAYTPDTVAGVGVVNCAGYSLAHLKVVVAVTDLRSAPALTLIPFTLNLQDSFYDSGQLITVPLLTTVGQSLRQDYWVNVDGSTGLVVLLDSIAGQGTAVSITVELS